MAEIMLYAFLILLLAGQTYHIVTVRRWARLAKRMEKEFSEEMEA